MPKALQTQLEIDLKALAHNYQYLKSKLSSKTRFLGVVKAFAYGNDSITIAKTLTDLGADYLAVAYVHEGVALRDAGIELPILVLHPQISNFKTLIDHCLEPSLYSSRVLKTFIKEAESRAQINFPVHIKFNTGLNRLGFLENDMAFIMSQLKGTEAIKVTSIFSHLAASEDINEQVFTQTQISHLVEISETPPVEGVPALFPLHSAKLFWNCSIGEEGAHPELGRGRLLDGLVVVEGDEKARLAQHCPKSSKNLLLLRSD